MRIMIFFFKGTRDAKVSELFVFRLTVHFRSTHLIYAFLCVNRLAKGSVVLRLLRKTNGGKF